MRFPKFLALMVAAFLVGAVALAVVPALARGGGAGDAGLLPAVDRGGSSGSLAPTFSLTDIYGQSFSLANYRGSDAVLIEFTSLSCSECQIVEKSIASLYAQYNATGATNVKTISIYIEPSFGDTVPALKTYHTQNAITWTMAQDTPSLAVSNSYGVVDIPDVFVIDKQGHAVYDQTGAQSTSQIQTAVSGALAGTAAPIAIVTVSVFLLAAIAGVSTFFSPCAFPMFPGYMGLFLGLNTGNAAATSPSGPTYQRAARRAAIAGSATALGMIIVFLAIGVGLVLAAAAISGYIPDLQIVVGAILIGLGALLLTNLQYWRIVTPFQELWRRLRGAPKDAGPAAIGPTGAPGEGLYLKLFGYGVGYAAAAAGCVAPVIFSAIVAGLALGFVGGLITILIYSLTAALLMVLVTVLLAVASRRFINQLKAATPIIKKVSAAALIVVGVYLVYFYYTAWVVK